MDDLISRQAAISEIMEDLEDRSLHDDPATPEDYAEGYDEGIRNAAAIVLQMPSAQPSVSKEEMVGDAVSRQAAIEAMRKAKDKSEAHRMLVQLPSAQPTGTNTVQVEDCISREAALTALERDEEYDKDIPNRADGVRDAIITISALPSAQPGWIPVTERLPKKDGDYLVTTHSGQIARYIFIGGSSEEYWRRCATAWMSLPTPYREGEQDGET